MATPRALGAGAGSLLGLWGPWGAAASRRGAEPSSREKSGKGAWWTARVDAQGASRWGLPALGLGRSLCGLGTGGRHSGMAATGLRQPGLGQAEARSFLQVACGGAESQGFRSSSTFPAPGPGRSSSGWSQPTLYPSSAATMSLHIQFEQLTDARWTELLPQIQQCPVVRLEDCGVSGEARCGALSKALRANSALTELSLAFNALGDAGVGQVLQALQGPGCQVHKLSLQTCCLTEAGCGVLPGALRSMPALRELQLSDNALGDAGLRLLCQGLLDPECHVEKLRLEYCKLSAAGCEPLAAVLRAKPGLKELALSNNDLGEAGVRALCAALRDAAPQLEVLRLETCGLTAANCAELAEVAASMGSLKELHLGDNPLGDAGLAALCAGLLRPSSQLRTLWLWDCSFGADGCRDLCRLLKVKDSLKEVSVSGNALGDQGARLLCEALLEPGCGLQTLWVKSCDLTAACCPHFGSVLAQSTRLLELQLSSNPLGDAGVEGLCQGLGQPGCVLQALCLGDCEVGNAGCSRLASALLSTPSLRRLDLSNNCMGDPGLQQLVDSVRQPACALEQLVLYDIYWTQDMEEQLHALEEARPPLRVIC